MKILFTISVNQVNISLTDLLGASFKIFILVEKDVYFSFLNLTGALISNNEFFLHVLSINTRENMFEFISIKTTLKKVYGFVIFSYEFKVRLNKIFFKFREFDPISFNHWFSRTSCRELLNHYA